MLQGGIRRGGAAAATERFHSDEAISFAEERDVNLVALDNALEALATLDGEQSRIVELRFFGGLSIKEIASVLDISETTVSRKWNTAKLWLHDQIATKE